MHAILLVGGKGTRLAPETTNLPKALVKLGDHPVLEVILRQLRAHGFERATLCIAHLGDMIRARFGDGRRLGIAIDYSEEPHPLGTAGPLQLIPDWSTPAVVMNGDVLTTLDLANLYRTHQRNEAMLTVALQRRWLSTSVGLVRMAGDRVLGVQEKPSFRWDICSGIYVADPLVRKYLPEGVRVDMPGLISTLVDGQEPVYGHPFMDAWWDIGTPGQLDRARAEFLADPDRYLHPQRQQGPTPTRQHLVDVELT